MRLIIEGRDSKYVIKQIKKISSDFFILFADVFNHEFTCCVRSRFYITEFGFTLKIMGFTSFLQYLIVIIFY